jgi:hypothetical protein
MRRIVLTLVAGVLVVCGCKKDNNSVEVKRANLDEPLPVEQVKVDWAELEDRVGKDVELRQKVKAFAEEYMSDEGAVSTEQAVSRAYGIVNDPNGARLGGDDAIGFLIDLDVGPLLCEELLHEHVYIVGEVASALGGKADKGVKDKQAIPYLIHALEKWVDMPGSSDSRSACRPLGEAIVKIADLDVEIGKWGKGLDEVISQAKEWARRNGIKLLDE